MPPTPRGECMAILIKMCLLFVLGCELWTSKDPTPRAAQSRPERSLRAVRGTALGRPEPLRVARSGRSASPRAIPSEEPLRIARSVPRAAQSHSELLAKPIGELGVTCTLRIRCSVLLHLVPSSPCMYMHGFALVYKYMCAYVCMQQVIFKCFALRPLFKS